MSTQYLAHTSIHLPTRYVQDILSLFLSTGYLLLKLPLVLETDIGGFLRASRIFITKRGGYWITLEKLVVEEEKKRVSFGSLDLYHWLQGLDECQICDFIERKDRNIGLDWIRLTEPFFSSYSCRYWLGALLSQWRTQTFCIVRQLPLYNVLQEQ